MKEGRAFQNALLVSGMIGIFILAGVFDVITRILVERNSQLGDMDIALIWLVSLFQFLWFVALIGLVWLMISGGGFSRWVSGIFLLVGLFLLFFSAILYVFEFPDSIYVVVPYLSPGMMLFQASGAVAAVGLISLWFWRPSESKVLGGQAFIEDAPEPAEK